MTLQLLFNWYILLITFICIWFSYCVLLRYRIYGIFDRLGIPGPKPNLLYGNYHEMIGPGMETLMALKKWIKEFGPVFGFYRIKTPTIVVTDPDIMKSILIKDFHNFTDRPKFFNRGIGPFQNMLHILRQKRWKQVRKILTPTFSAKKMKQMSPHINSAIDLLLEMLNKNDKKEINIKATFQGLTLQVIGECAFNLEMNCQKDENDPFLKTVRGFFTNINNVTHSIWVAIPEIEWIFQPILRTYHELTDLKWLYWLHNQIKTMMKMRREAGKNEYQVDVLQLLLNAADNIDEEGDNFIANGTSVSLEKTLKKSLTENEIESNTFTFLLVGYETTATTLTYVSYLLAKYPNIQHKLQKEIDTHLGKDVKPDYETVQSLHYLEQVVNETLRIYPPVSFFVARNCSENFEIKGINFPKDCAIVIPVWNIHHNPEIWPEPDNFDPERFSSENKTYISPMNYIPFGAGPRNCIGSRFALLEVKVAIARILQKYILVKGKKFQENLNLMNTGAFLQPKDDLFVIFKKRELIEQQ